MSFSANRPFSWRRLLLTAALATTSACGYRFTPQGGDLPGGARSLHVPLFRNATSEAGVEAWFTEALRTELARRGLQGGEASDVVVLGSVTEVSDGAAIYASAGGLPISVRVHSAATVRVMRGSKTLREVKVAGDEDYKPTPGLGAEILRDEANRRTALRRLSQRLMREALERLQSP